MKRTIILATILIIGILLITSCKPAGKAIYMEEQEYDLANFPGNIFHEYDLEMVPVPIRIYTAPEFESISEQLAAKIENKTCSGFTGFEEGCPYTFTPDFIDTIPETDLTGFIAIGTCDTVGDLLDSSTCESLVEGKAVIQYINNRQLVVAGGTDADVTEAVYTLIDHMDDRIYLSGYYSDIINTENLIAVSYLTQTNNVQYTEKFYFYEGANTIINPLEVPYDKETVTAFFGANIDKINKAYFYDTEQEAYTGVYNPDTDAPSNLEKFAEKDKVYVVDAKEDFEITVYEALSPEISQLAGYHKVPAQTQKILNAFVTGAAVKQYEDTRR